MARSASAPQVRGDDVLPGRARRGRHRLHPDGWRLLRQEHQRDGLVRWSDYLLIHASMLRIVRATPAATGSAPRPTATS
eukprot:scaffold87524_cov60-Phaeocystis_antarctica.AAC.3